MSEFKAQLLYSPNSPYVRKVLIAAGELGLKDQLEFIEVAPNPTAPSAQISKHNPLGKIPCLIPISASDSASSPKAIFDSSVIVQYLQSLTSSKEILAPVTSEKRYEQLTVESLCDGMADACLLMRYEGLFRDPGAQSDAWLKGQKTKVLDGFQALTTLTLPSPSSPTLTIDGIAIAAILSYLDLRWADLDGGWRKWKGADELRAWYDEGAMKRESVKSVVSV